jgi:uncharacterized coiled-coil protein SlyX
MDEFKAALLNVQEKHDASLREAKLRVEELENQVSEQESEIRDLKQLCAKREEDIENWIALLAEKDKEVEALVHKSAEKEREAFVLIKKRDETIDALKSSLAGKINNTELPMEISPRFVGQENQAIHVSQSTSSLSSSSPSSLITSSNLHPGRHRVEDSPRAMVSSGTVKVDEKLFKTGTDSVTNVTSSSLLTGNTLSLEDPVPRASDTHLHSHKRSLTSHCAGASLTTDSNEEVICNSPHCSMADLTSLQSIEAFSPSLLGTVDKKDKSPPIFDETMLSPSLLNQGSRQSHSINPQHGEVVGCEQNVNLVQNVSSSDTESLSTSPDIHFPTTHAHFRQSSLFSEIPPSDTQVLLDSFETQPPSPEVGNSAKRPLGAQVDSPRQSGNAAVENPQETTNSSEPTTAISEINKSHHVNKYQVPKTKEMCLKKKSKRKGRQHQTTLTQTFARYNDTQNDCLQSSVDERMAHSTSHSHDEYISSPSSITGPGQKKSPAKIPEIQRSPIKSLYYCSVVTVVPQTPALYVSSPSKPCPQSPTNDRLDPDETVLPMSSQFSTKMPSMHSRRSDSISNVEKASHIEGRDTNVAQYRDCTDASLAHRQPFCRKRKLDEPKGAKETNTTEPDTRIIKTARGVTTNVQQDKMRERLKLPSYLCDKAVRKKDERKLLHTKECPECIQWYKDRPEHMSTTCKHRRTYERTDTPVDYFDIGMPLTPRPEEDFVNP